MVAHAFVSVFFEKEIDLLRLQARSMALYLPPDLVGEIVFIDNCGIAVDARTASSILDELGTLRSKARIVHARAVAIVPITSGWRSQQILKLKIAEQIACDRYVVLDAKSHFIRPLEAAFLIAGDNRAMMNFYDFENHPLRAQLVSVLKFMGVYDDRHICRFTATVAPFTIYRQAAIDCIAKVEAISGAPFSQCFVSRELVEFFLYSASILASAGGLEGLYAERECECQIVWYNDVRPETIAKMLAVDAPIFAVHRRAIEQFEAAQIEMVARFWTARGLFPDVAAASGFLVRNRDDLRRRPLKATILALFVKAITAARRVRAAFFA